LLKFWTLGVSETFGDYGQRILFILGLLERA